MRPLVLVLLAAACGQSERSEPPAPESARPIIAPAPLALADAAPPLDPRAIAQLSDPDPEVRKQGATSLWAKLDRRAVELLIPLLADPDEGVRATIAIHLWDSGQEAAEPLIAALQHADPRVRAGAARALSRVRDARAVAPLAALIQDPEASVRASAVATLGHYEDPRAADAIIEALDDPAPDVRRAAVYATRDPRALPHVLELLDGRDQMMALEALGRIHDPRAVEPLMRLLKTEDAFTRQQVSVALAAQGEHALPRLQSALETGGDKLRRDAARALAGIKAPAAGQSLLAALQKQDLAAVAGGAQWLCRQRDAKPDPVLLAALSRHGDVELAGTLLNCGGASVLYEAAAKWAERRGYDIKTTWVTREP
jgi:HEAT repeat protein